MPKDLTSINYALQEIHKAITVKKILVNTLKQLDSLFPSCHCFIFLLSDSENKSRLFTLSSDHKHLKSKIAPATALGIEDWVFTTGQATLMNKQHVSPLLASECSIPNQSSTNLIAVPLKKGEHTLGVLELFQVDSSTAFKSKDLQFLETLSEHIIIALDHARQLERHEAFNQELEKEIKSTTDQLRAANDHLRQADIAKSESISMVAHELRTPITSISGFAKLFIDGKLGPLNSEQSEFCGIIKKNAVNIERMINDLLVLTKLELDKLDMHFEKIACQDLIIEAIASLKGSNPQHAGRILFNPITPKHYLAADRLRLLQVLTNLISNALKYSPQEKPVEVHFDASTDMTLIAIDDYGTSLTPEQRYRVFEKFYRIKKAPNISGNGHSSGSGLGLAICQNIIQKHHGQIWTEPTSEGGNSFKFTVPTYQD